MKRRNHTKAGPGRTHAGKHRPAGTKLARKYYQTRSNH